MKGLGLGVATSGPGPRSIEQSLQSGPRPHSAFHHLSPLSHPLSTETWTGCLLTGSGPDMGLPPAGLTPKALCLPGEALPGGKGATRRTCPCPRPACTSLGGYRGGRGSWVGQPRRSSLKNVEDFESPAFDQQPSAHVQLSSLRWDNR